MKRAELIKALNRLKIETGSIVCLGCGHEHNCGTQGCALIRAAIEELEHAQRQSDLSRTRAAADEILSRLNATGQDMAVTVLESLSKHPDYRRIPVHETHY